MNDSFEFTLHSQLTKEDWDKISDVEHERTTSVTFQTPQGRQVRYIRSDVLDMIRAEIEQIADEEQKHDKKWAIGLRYAVKIIDKYRSEDKG